MSARELITEHLDLWTGAVTKKSSSGRGSNGKIVLTGVKKLRELILELAVRGLLTEQRIDETDASEIVANLDKEQNRIVAAGLIKKPKPLKQVNEGEKPYLLPNGWQWIRLGQTMEMYNGRAFKSSEWSTSGLPIVRIQNLNDPKAPTNYFSGPLDGRHSIDTGTFLISWSGTPGTSFGAFIWTRGPAALNQHINKCVFFGDFLNTEFMQLAVNGQMKNFIQSAQGGVGLKHVTKGVLSNALIALPPKEEQHRIVQKVDELMALCDRLEQQTSDQLDAHETLVDTLLGTLTQSENATELTDNWARLAAHFDTLFTTEQSIDKLKQTILQLAVMGRLVEQDVKDEPASDLIQRINAERLKLEGEGKVRAAKKAARASAVEPLPRAWATCTLGTCIKLISGQHLKGDEYFDNKRPDSIPYLTGPAEFGARTPEPQRHTFERRAVAEKGDILITCKGSGVGKLNIASEVIAISRQLMAARPILINAHFLYLLLDSLRDAIREKTVGIAIPGISRGDILDANIQLPPLNEQHRIVQKVDELMALCDQLKERLSLASETRCQLAAAIVEQATS